MVSETIVLIPSLEPDERLPEYAKKLLAEGFAGLVVIDDGSSEKTQYIFDALSAMEGVTVLHHEVNRGKGVGLKTGYTYIRDHMPHVKGILTADADGQHTVPDCVALAKLLDSGEAGRTLYLGSRDLLGRNVPWKSKFGNGLTTFLFWALYGRWLPDTQTGLRAFTRENLQTMIDVPGDRYEYEMQQLIACARAGMKITPMTIETIYENDNAGSHFNPIRDGLRIYKVMFGSFFRFIGSSLLCFLVDQGLAALLTDVLKMSVEAGNALSRVVSGIINFTLNRKLVFKDASDVKKSAVRYFVLWTCVLVISTLSVKALTLLGGLKLRWLFKLIVDTALYFLSYNIQDRWVFPRKNGKDESK